MASKILEICLCLILNVIASIAYVQINKLIIQYYEMSNLTLMFFNLLIASIVLKISILLGLIKFVRVPLNKMLPMAFTFCGLIVFTNFSLEYNSIGTFDGLKILTTPGIILISSLFYSQSYSFKVKLSIIPVVLGIAINSLFDLKFDFDGILIGVVAAVLGSLNLVLISEKQKELRLNPMQLLAYQVPLSALILLIVIPLFEPVFSDGGIFDYENTVLEWFLIVLSSLMAFVVNATVYWMISISSPLTYNMIGSIGKSNLILIAGVSLFGLSLSIENVFSMCSVVIGLAAFLKFKLEELKSSENPKRSMTNANVKNSIENDFLLRKHHLANEFLNVLTV